MTDRAPQQIIDAGLIREKQVAARERGYHQLVDLFSGCGGLTLGFDHAGFRCVAAVEADEDARQAHESNFRGRVETGRYAAYGDITTTSPEEVAAHLAPLAPERCVDIVVGGPPCQAFSRLGRAALWDLAGRTNAHHDDPRATLYEYLLKYLVILQPIAFVLENVKEMGRHHGRNIAHEIAVTTEALGYTTRYTLLNAVWYGVPQLRERLVIIGIHRSLGVTPRFPTITHAYDIPAGYATSRAGTGKIEPLPPHDYYVDHYVRAERMVPAVTAAMAFADLPPITRHLTASRTREHPRRLHEVVRHREHTTNAFITEMRGWPGFTSDGRSAGHIIRYTPRDYETFRRMPHGGMYPEALATAEAIFRERLTAAEAGCGAPIPEGSERWEELHRRIVPPYKVENFANKFRKMHENGPACTVAAHLSKDAYSHIHFDNDQARCISLREAARLQSFPDAFAFHGGMNTQLRQIGNAVPPLMARAIAEEILRTIQT